MDAQCLGSRPVRKQDWGNPFGICPITQIFSAGGTFPAFKNEVAGQVIAFVATQVGVAPEAYLQYDWQGRTIKDHRAEIRRLLDFRKSTVADAEQMQQWLIAEILPQEYQEERLREQVYAWFRRMHLEAPTPDRLARLLRSATHTFEQQFCDATLARLPEASQAALEALLLTESVASPKSSEGEKEEQEEIIEKGTEAPGTQMTSTLEHIRQDPGRVGLATMLEEMAKLRRIRELMLPDNLFPGIARKVLMVYRNRASVEEPSRMMAHRPAKRLTYLAALCVMRAEEITDGLVDLLIQIVHKIDVRAEEG